MASREVPISGRSLKSPRSKSQKGASDLADLLRLAQPEPEGQQLTLLANGPGPGWGHSHQCRVPGDPRPRLALNHPQRGH
jgi:hypothetical protein